MFAFIWFIQQTNLIPSSEARIFGEGGKNCLGEKPILNNFLRLGHFSPKVGCISTQNAPSGYATVKTITITMKKLFKNALKIFAAQQNSTKISTYINLLNGAHYFFYYYYYCCGYVFVACFIIVLHLHTRLVITLFVYKTAVGATSWSNYILTVRYW